MERLEATGPPDYVQTHQQISDLIRASIEGIAVLDTQGVVVFANPAAEAMFGKQSGGAIGYHLGYPAVDGKPAEIILRPGKSDMAIVEMRAVETSWEGKPAFVVNLHDITERKRAEEMILAQQNLSIQYLQIAGVMICAVNSIGEITLINRKGVDLLKYKDEQELLGKNWFEVILHKNDVAAVKIVFNQLISGNINQVEYYENNIVTKYGEERIVAFHNSLLRDKDNKISGVLFSGEDITDRKRAEEELRRSEEEFRSLAESMPQIVWVTRKDGWNIYFNQQWVDYTGLTLEESYGHGWNIPFHPDDQQRAWSAWENATKNNGIYSLECRLRRADGVYHWWLVRGVPLLDETGEVIKWFGTCTDIDHIKNAEKQLKDTLETLRKAVGVTIQVLANAVETRDPYTSGHQIRSADLARTIAMEMGLPKDKIEGIRMACSIHDIGKLSIPADILSKPTNLSEIEFALVKEHANRGYEMLKDVVSQWPLAEIIRQHHERMDGSGYPRGLKGDDILIEARILAVADVVEAIASHRPYRPALGIDAALEEIEKNKGVLYDPEATEVCLRLFKEKGYNFN